MNYQLTSLAFHFLEQNFINELKRQAQSRSKPSKAVLEALKHSTALNKDFKAQIQSLRQQLSAVSEQNEFLKEMVDNLKREVEYLKTSKQEKVKKLCQTQSHLHTKVQMLSHQNSLLKKQSQVLKNKLQSSLSQTFSTCHINTQQQKPPNYQSLTQASTIVPSQPLHQSIKFHTYLNQEEKKSNYMSNEQQTQPNSKLKIQGGEECQRNQRRQKGEEEEFGFKSSKVEKGQCEELTHMLNLRHYSMMESEENSESQNCGEVNKSQREQKNSKNQDEQCSQQLKKSIIDRDSIHSIPQDVQQLISPCSGRFSSFQSLSPKITQITSEQQIFIQEPQHKVPQIQTPTLQKYPFACIKNPSLKNQASSKFKIFADQNDSRQQLQSVSKQYTFSNSSHYQRDSLNNQKPSDFTFLNLQTRKSIEDHTSLKFPSQKITDSHNQSAKISIGDNGSFYLNVDEKGKGKKGKELMIENISGVDYKGLMEDIGVEEEDEVGGQGEESDGGDRDGMGEEGCLRMQDFNVGSQVDLDLVKIKSKRTTSQLVTPDRMLEIMQSLKPKTAKSTLMPSSQPKTLAQSCFPKPDTQLNPKTPAPQINIHCPLKYMNVSESYKTIDLSKSQKQIDSKKIINKQEQSQLSKNSSLLGKNMKGSCMNGSRVMMNSKLMMFSNVRGGQRNKTLSPVSIDDEVKEVEQHEQEVERRADNIKSKTVKNCNSYAIIHSTRSKKMMTSFVNGNKSMLNPNSSLDSSNCSQLLNVSIVAQSPSVKKKLDDRIVQSSHPLVTFKDLEEQIQERNHQMERRDLE